ncbi:hypothetical protein SLS59_010025 [Nothophoma quercina]|uniref:glucan endo-1,3-beta-D-glucosidase n=1 Tax=Nothophoma quercina TaxID=749835 RepID=A0ABR3QI68_9PLEO
MIELQRRFAFLLLFIAPLACAANKVYTGFNYGAFWGEQSNVKRYADFHQGFELAKNLTDTPVSFDSARLYTCISTGTKDDPTEAFQAAIDTDTNLLLGMWISPGANEQSNTQKVDNELAALGRGFEQHGQKLADLVIGLSVGSEDIYRFNNAQLGLGSDNLLNTIKSVREKIAASSYAKYMESKPIGHTDTALYSVVSGSDFVGMNAYPYWEGQSIDNVNASFMSILRDTQRRAGNTPVWISEIDWPIRGKQIKDAVANPENYQRYWNEVGCNMFGKYTTFWFELLQDSTTDQPDWGLLDPKTHMPRIKDLSCGTKSNNWTAPSADGLSDFVNTTLSKPLPTTLSTVYLPASVTTSTTSSLWKVSSNLTVMPTRSARTTHITETRTITVIPSSLSTTEEENDVTMFQTVFVSPALSPTPTSPASHEASTHVNESDKVSICITMMDLQSNGIFIPVAVHASNMTACSPPPQFTGSPFTMVAAPTASPTAPSERKSSFDLYAPSRTTLLSATVSAQTASAPNSNGPTCLTSAGVAYEAVISNGKTFLGPSTPSCPPQTTEALAPINTPFTALTTPSNHFSLTPSTALSNSLLSVRSSSLSPLASLPTTFSTVTIPALAPQPASTSSVFRPAGPASSSSFSHSLTSSMFAPSSTTISTPPASTISPAITPPPTSTSRTHLTPVEGATVCTTPNGVGYKAVISNGYPHLLNPLVECTSIAPLPTAEPGCISVNGKWWEAVWDSDGRKRISAPGVECTSTSPPAQVAIS